MGRDLNLHRALNTLLHDDIGVATGLDSTEFEFLLRLAPRATASSIGNETRRTGALSWLR